MERRRFWLPAALALIGMLLAILGVALVTSRSASDQARLDRGLATAADAKAALVLTELERARAMALVTARVPPFSELFAAGNSLAARIAAVAGPIREINNALEYDSQLYPSRFFELGYVDASGRERARVVNGVKVPESRLLHDVRNWPSFVPGLSTPPGTAEFSLPFMSPIADVPVLATTAAVSVGGRVRAYIEIDLRMSAIVGVLKSDLPRSQQAAIVDAAGQTVAVAGSPLSLTAFPLAGVVTMNGLRVAGHEITENGLTGGPWYAVVAGRPPSVLSAILAPQQAVVLLLALAFLVAAAVGLRRIRLLVAWELETEQRARTEAERLSRLDPLTGLYNRRHIAETIENELARADRHGGAVGVLMFDIDYFKRVNDAHGHAGGDAVLVEVGRRLLAGVRSWDVVARVGGEEFCVVAPEVKGEDDVLELGQRLRDAIRSRAVTLKEGLAIPVTVSLGVALLHGSTGSAENAFDCADRALYAAKRRGRDRVCCYSELDHTDLRAEQPECLHLAEALAAAGDLREGLSVEHSREMAALSAEVAMALGLNEDEVLRARLGGWLHDVGNLSIPDGLLGKPGPLSDAEWELVKAHPVVGDELVRTFPELALAAGAVRHHHERWDGRGYPDGLAAEAIPLEARIVAAVDAYQAMVSDRAYRPACTDSEAADELRACAGTQFDPRVVDALLGVLAGRHADALADAR